MEVPKTGHHDLDAINRAEFDGSPYGEYVIAYLDLNPNASALPPESRPQPHRNRSGAAVIRAFLIGRTGRHSA